MRIIFVLILPRWRDVVEFNKLLGVFQVEVAMQNSDAELSLEAVLQYKMPEDFAHELHPIFGMKSCRSLVEVWNLVELRDAVWLQNLRHFCVLIYLSTVLGL